MEGYLVAVIRIVDVFRLFDLSPSEVLKLRLVSRGINNTICSRDKFWKLAFPLFPNLAEEWNPVESSYYSFVVQSQRVLFLDRALNNSKHMIADIQQAFRWAKKYHGLEAHKDRIFKDLRAWKKIRKTQAAELRKISGLTLPQLSKHRTRKFYASTWCFPKPIQRSSGGRRIMQTARIWQQTAPRIQAVRRIRHLKLYHYTVLNPEFERLGLIRK